MKIDEQNVALTSSHLKVRLFWYGIFELLSKNLGCRLFVTSYYKQFTIIITNYIIYIAAVILNDFM
jgi:hypothetical protein